MPHAIHTHSTGNSVLRKTNNVHGDLFVCRKQNLFPHQMLRLHVKGGGGSEDHAPRQCFLLRVGTGVSWFKPNYTDSK